MKSAANSPRQRRLFVPPPLSEGRRTLRDAAAHYVGRVLRLTVDAPLVVFDGQGYEANAAIEHIDKHGVKLNVGTPRYQQPVGIDVTVALPTPKGERADWVVEKLTEVGVASVHWLTCERSVTTANPGGKRAERWRRIAEAAAGQCGRAHVPCIQEPVSLPDFVSRCRPGMRLLAHPGQRSLPQLLSSCQAPPATATIVIGPEGGFSDGELLRTRQAGYNHCAVGPYAMRIETAAVVAAGLLLATAATSAMASDHTG